MSAGMYLRVLRERQKLTREQLVERVKTNSHETIKLSDVSLWSIEDGRQEPKGRLLFALIDALGARLEDVSRLMLDDSATVEDARALAEMRLAETRQADHVARQLVSDQGDEKTRKLVERFRTDTAFRDALFTLIDPD